MASIMSIMIPPLIIQVIESVYSLHVWIGKATPPIIKQKVLCTDLKNKIVNYIVKSRMTSTTLRCTSSDVEII